MNITAFSDIHSCLDFLRPSTEAAEDVKNADIVLISGDITNFGGARQAKAIISEIQSYNENVFAVPGNCDLPEVDKHLKKEGKNLTCNFIEYGEFVLAGVGGFGNCNRHEKCESSNEYFQICLQHVAERHVSGKDLIFVSHFPPFNTSVDQTGLGKHGGMRVMRDFIEEHQPLLSVTGHIHEGAGVDKIGRTTLVNPGSFRQGSYAVIEIDGETVRPQIKQA